MNKKIFIILVVFLLLIGGCNKKKGKESTPEPVIAPEELPKTGQPLKSLRVLAKDHNLYLGSALSTKAFVEDSYYGELFAKEFNVLTIENAFKMDKILVQEGVYDFETTDAVIDFAQKNNIKVKWHVLVYHNALPSWIENKDVSDWTRDEMINILEKYVKTVVARYKGRILYWEAVNEGFDEYGSVKNKFFTKTIGEDYLEMPFVWIKEVDPNAVIFYNENGIEFPGQKQDAVYKFVKSLQQKGIPIDGLGIQMHISLDEGRAIGFDKAIKEIKKTFKRFNDLGLDVHITELDIRIQEPATEQDFRDQAELYEKVLDVCLSAKKCGAFVMWGFTDKYSWVPSFFPGFGSALIFDENYKNKQAYYALSRRLAKK